MPDFNQTRSFNLGIAQETCVESALVYDEFAYSQSLLGDSAWFYRSYEQLEKRLPFSQKTLQRAIKKLVDTGWVEKKLKKIDGAPVCHYRLIRNLDSVKMTESMDSVKMTESYKGITTKETTKAAEPKGSDSPKVKNNSEDSNTSLPGSSFGAEVLQDAAPPVVKETSVVNKLMWDVVKKYNLPVVNANHIRKWAKDFEKMEDGQEYLKQLLDKDLRGMEGEFKPTLNVPYDLVAKKLKIQRFYNGGEDKKPRDPRVFGEL